MAANGPIPRCPPAKSPFAENTLDAPRITANSRFLTKCYLLFATKGTNTRHPCSPVLRKTDLSGQSTASTLDRKGVKNIYIINGLQS
jgi:hypothetical protein